jgi:hypothetical protein
MFCGQLCFWIYRALGFCQAVGTVSILRIQQAPDSLLPYQAQDSLQVVVIVNSLIQ